MWDNLTFRWKLSNRDEQSRPVILRVHCGTRSIDYHAQATQLDPTLVAASAGERDGVERGVLRYAGWFTPDTTLDRELALTRSGVLVVRDSLLPGANADGMTAGPVWHLASTAAPVVGPHWFDSVGGTTELLVWFSQASGRDFGGQTFDVWSKDGHQAVFARESLRAGRSVRFVTVLVPHRRGADAAALAERIVVESGGFSATGPRPSRR